LLKKLEQQEFILSQLRSDLQSRLWKETLKQISQHASLSDYQAMQIHALFWELVGRSSYSHREICFILARIHQLFVDSMPR